MVKFGGVVVTALALVQSLQATPISGNISFTGWATLDSSSAGNATAVTSWIAPVNAGGTTGTFGGIANGTAAAFSPAVWNFNTSTPINNFWMVGGFSFELLSSSITSQGYDASGGSVTVDGSGWVSATGYTTTLMSWHFTTQDNGSGTTQTQWSFSAGDQSVPDGGATVMLLGIALSGVALLRKKLNA